ncbi:MAG: tRNA pseudouridine(55) synthase TruB [Gammaproteobacteria bacterium]|nr:tRNA pseudouridine(55) synthase TruB [Gammaproteobacteria bacterium]MBK81230.1 tRNA pseudouridine(55) synthase TruB [Gammaproteobacteria bacterium]
MAKRRRGRDVSGILVVDKPQGWSSNDAVQKAKRLFNARKVGHTGALDPLATGVLPLCFGEATKFSQYLLSSDKKYWTRIKLGVATDSGDSDGNVMATRPVEGIDEARVEAALEFFRGEIDQVPSMFSAVKHQGQPLYKLARQGIEIEREARRVKIFSNELVSLEGDELTLSIHCSKGTYVRTIAQELGEHLGCGGHVVALRRLSAGPFTEQDMVTFETLEAALEQGSLDPFLLPVASAVGDWPEITLSDDTAYYLRQGQPVLVPQAPSSGWVRLSERLDEGATRFLGVGEVLDDGRVAPRRLVVST